MDAELKKPVSFEQILEAGLTDWRQIFSRLKARFVTHDFAQGWKFASLIAESAEAADHHPELIIHYGEVLLTLWSHDVGGLTLRDIRLAQEISKHAASLGITADTRGLTQVELGLDVPQGHDLAPYYAALLGGEVVDGEVVDSSEQVPTVWWQEAAASEGSPENATPREGDQSPRPSEPSQRWHLDVWVAHDDAERRVQAVLAAGGTLISDENAPSFWVLADAEGNRSCICTPQDR